MGKGKGKAMPLITEADLVKALQTENIGATTLQEVQVEAIDKYCGIEELADFMPHGEGPSKEQNNTYARVEEEDYGESILGELEFNSEDEKLTNDKYVSEEESH